ncbi:hypothetical protein VO54_03120 [Elizabethkingia miricola]|nr:hypothetical protein VO54_03120 [Elizabethkingia miricola]
MTIKHMAIALLALPLFQTKAQQLAYTPDIVLGHRSYTYLHNISYQFNDKLKINNLTLFDTEYTKDKENIFFIRNTISYSLTNKISFHAGFGMKNPGAFFTAFAQYRIAKPTYSFSYSVGVTYQKGFTLEQSVSAEYAPYLNDDLQAYFNVLAIANLNFDGYQRGLQFFRLGLKQKKLSYGVAINLDQWNNTKKTLENIGVFTKYSF